MTWRGWKLLFSQALWQQASEDYTAAAELFQMCKSRKEANIAAGPTSRTSPLYISSSLRLGVGVPRNADLLEIEGLFTQGSRPGQTVGESVGEILIVDSSDWSNGVCYHICYARTDNEFKSNLSSSEGFELTQSRGCRLKLSW
jgi:hypothetical protein